MSMQAPWLAVTPGDPEGVGPEIAWKCIQRHPAWGNRCIFFGSEKALRRVGAQVETLSFDDLKSYLATARPSLEPLIRLVPAPETPPRKAKKDFSLPGYQSGWAIETAVQSIQKKHLAGLVTGPISKERLQDGGYRFAGHTEMLADLCRVKEVTMMLANPALRVSLVTVHVPLKKVAALTTPAAVTRAIRQTADFLRNRCGIERPRIAVLGLNPHAGEAGRLGNEEQKVLRPVLKRLSRGTDLVLDGPFPADTFFALHMSRTPPERHDAVVSCYHDQGLTAVKLVDFKRTVNLTLGLPWIRTSVDHGTAFDIAGKGIADPSSFEAAFEEASRLTLQRVPASQRAGE
jgi:4-hydroxythreonine-4-phosphate dehydrogenase